jgi:MOSC domain-containing protein YiiM
MHVVSVQIGTARDFDLGSRRVESGIDKRPVETISVGTGGVVGDAVVNTRHHGGPDQAVYVYTAADYTWWQSRLGRSLEPGTFGENLTISDTPNTVRVGDRLAVGDVVLEVTAPRIPCSTFAARMGEENWIRRFRDAGRPGFYCRVLASGVVAPGDSVEWISGPVEHVTLEEMIEDFYASPVSLDRIRRALASPIAERARAGYQSPPE